MKSRLFFIILTIYIALASIYSVVNPLFESPDEVWHYEYVRWLVEGEGLPVPEDVGHAPWHQEGSQPPLYYIAAAALTFWIPTDNAPEVIRYNPHAAIGQPDAVGNKNMMLHGDADAWPWRGVALAAHIARFFSILIGAVTVAATYATSRVIFPERENAALLAMSIVAFNPQFLFLSAAVNNDNLVACFSAVAIWYGARLIKETWTSPYGTPTNWQAAIFGLLAGGAALSKLSGLLVSLFVALTFGLIAWRRKSFPLLLRSGLISGGVMAAVSGWWFVRNWLLFGDPLALSAMFAILPRRTSPPTLAELASRVEGVWRSVWAVFGWFNVGVHPWLYTFYSLLALLGIIGFLLGGLLYFVRKDQASTVSPAERSAQAIQILLLVIWVSALVISLLRWAQMRYPQGRLLFPALSAAAVIFAIGLTNWLPRQIGPIRVRRGGVALLIGILLSVAAVLPWQTIAPTYRASVPLLAADASAIDGANFGDQVALVGAFLPRTELQSGEQLSLQLEWVAQQDLAKDYSVFIHLIDENNIIQAQRDSFPVRGNFPTSEWQPGNTVHDIHLVDLPLTMPASNRMKINVGLYEYATGERLIVGGSDHWTVGYVSLSPPLADDNAQNSGLPNPISINFEDKVELIGFEFDRYTMQPGETLTLNLWWNTLAAPLEDYVVFTHLVLPPEATWAQDDSRPQQGQLPTTLWEVGQRIEDQYKLVMPENAPHGVYFMEIGLYNAETGSRLDVDFSDKGIILGQIRVGN